MHDATTLTRQALVAANFTSITTAFAGSTVSGMRWLIDHVTPTAPMPVPRELLNLARQVADPTGDFAALRRYPGAQAVPATWAERTSALVAYRNRLNEETGAEGIDADAVLGALLHTHFLRSFGIEPSDKAVCLYLARAAALAHAARHGGSR
jgi:thiopeptide-type bacteriocin biosynthesis protein